MRCRINSKRPFNLEGHKRIFMLPTSLWDLWKLLPIWQLAEGYYIFIKIGSIVSSNDSQRQACRNVRMWQRLCCARPFIAFILATSTLHLNATTTLNHSVVGYSFWLSQFSFLTVPGLLASGFFIWDEDVSRSDRNLAQSVVCIAKNVVKYMYIYLFIYILYLLVSEAKWFHYLK